MLFLIVVVTIFDFPSASVAQPFLTGKEVLRIIQPLLSIPLLCMAYIRGYLQTVKMGSLDLFFTTFLFIIGIVAFSTGDGMHLTANLASRNLDLLSASVGWNNTLCDLSVPSTFIHDFYEHVFAHYYFLAGALIIWVALLNLFRHVPAVPLALNQKLAVVVSGVSFGITLAAIGAQFPKGNSLTF